VFLKKVLKKGAVLLNVKVNSVVFFNTIEYSAQGNRPVLLSSSFSFPLFFRKTGTLP
jgi:hypothetical protein